MELDDYPFPDKELFFRAEPELKRNPYLIMTARGCPYSCTFCSNDMLHDLYREEKTHVRRRSVDNVIAELLWARRFTSYRQVNFNDDVFTVGKPWLEEFVPKYREAIGVPYLCVTHPSAVTRDIVKLLQESGCRIVGAHPAHRLQAPGDEREDPGVDEAPERPRHCRLRRPHPRRSLRGFRGPGGGAQALLPDEARHRADLLAHLLPARARRSWTSRSARGS
jgi:hypothetical protein